MAFLVYFVVLLGIASGVLFGLDWANAPLHPPSAQEHTQAAAPANRSRTERAMQQRTPRATAAVPIGRAPPAPPETQAKVETAGRQPKPETTGSAPTQPAEADIKASAVKSEPVAAPQSRPEPVVQQPPPPANAASVETATGSQDTAKAAEQPQPQTSEARRASSRAAQRAARHWRRVHRRNGDEQAGPVPPWAARAAQEAEQERRSGTPAWAVHGAEAARRDAQQNAQPRQAFRPFWERENGWHFPW